MKKQMGCKLLFVTVKRGLSICFSHVRDDLPILQNIATRSKKRERLFRRKMGIKVVSDVVPNFL